jgi:autotransporter-associated beta strand protein
MLYTLWRRWLNERFRTGRRGRRSNGGRNPGHRLKLEVLEDRLAPATFTWTGAGGTANWSDGNNWLDDQGRPNAPPNGSDLVFPASASQLSSTNNNQGFGISTLTIHGSGYIFNGSDMTVNGEIIADNSTGTNTVNINLSFSSREDVTVSGSQASLNLAGVLGGDQGLRKFGTGTLMLSGANAYQGVTDVESGTLQLGAADAIPSTSSVQIVVGTLDLNDHNDTIGSLLGGGVVTLGSNPNTTLTTGVDNTSTQYGGRISGSGALTKSGTGTFILANRNNSYTGATNVNSGVLRLGDQNSIPATSAVTVAGGSTLNLNNLNDTVGSLAGAGSVTLGTNTNVRLTTGGNNATTTFSGVISGSGGLIKTGTGVQSLTHANMYAGPTAINSGTLIAAADDALGTGTTAATAATVTAGATLGFEGGIVYTRAKPVTLNGTGAGGAGAMLNRGGNNSFMGPITLGSDSTIGAMPGTALTLGGTVSGTGTRALTKAGGGMLVLSAANPYTGGTILMAGTLAVGNNTALGTGSLTLTGGVLQSSSSTSTVALNNTFTVNGPATVGGSNNLTLSNTGTLNSTLMVANLGTITVSGTLGGNGGLTKRDVGLLTISGNTNNTYVGETKVMAGMVKLSKTGGIRAIPGALTIGDGSNAAVVQLTARDQTAPTSAVAVDQGAQLDLNNNADTVGGLTLTAGLVTTGGSGVLTLNGNIVTNAAATAATINGNLALGTATRAITVVHGTGPGDLIIKAVVGGTNVGLTKLGGGMLELSAANTYTGPTTLMEGSLAVGDNSALGGGNLVLDGGRLQSTSMVTLSNTFVVGGAAAVGGGNPLTLSGTGSLGDTLTVENAVSGAITLSGLLIGSGSLTKTGAGTLELKADNAYTGTTRVAAGALTVNGNQPSSPVMVESDGTLKGTGTTGAINATGGTISPGNSPGILTARGDVTFSASATLAITVNGTTPGTGFSQLKAAGAVNLGGAQLQLTGDVAAVPEGARLTILTGASITGAFTVNFGQIPFGTDVTPTQVDLVRKISTTAAVKADIAAAVFGQIVHFTATITANQATATGTVTFQEGPTVLATQPLNGGQANLTSSALAAGTHNIHVTYGGGVSFVESSADLPYTVNKAESNVKVDASLSTSFVGQEVTFTAVVTVPPPGGGTLTGTVNFLEGPVALGSATLDPTGRARWASRTLPAGTHTILARYGGDPNFNASDSAGLAYTVKKVASATQVSASLSPAPVGQPVTFTAVVTASPPGSGTPLGAVVFTVDDTQPTRVSLNIAGQATSPAFTLTAGLHTVRARYEGSSSFDVSSADLMLEAKATGPLLKDLAVPTTLAGQQGQAFSGVVASFGTSAGQATAGDFTATITWGDDHTSAGGIAPDGRGGFTVNGTNTYAQEGPYPLSVRVGARDGSTATVSGTVHVARSGQPAATLLQVANGISHSDEYFRNFVTAVYHRYLGRGPDPAGLNAWVTGLKGSVTDEQLEAGFIGSPEYIADHGGTGEAWVRGMYKDLLGRTPAQSEVDTWLNLLNRNVAPTAIALGFAASPEREGQRVQEDYRRYLGRGASPAEVNLWVDLFTNHGVRNETVVAGFVGSPEYFGQKFGNARDWLFAAYQDILGRDVDEFGATVWLPVLGYRA